MIHGAKNTFVYWSYLCILVLYSSTYTINASYDD